jgi:transcriptional regulator with XRE-family HTH domain
MKKTSSSFGTLFAKARERDDYWVAKASLEFTEEISRLLATLHVSRSELARRLGTSTAYVTKILRGDVNFTLQTMVRLARALGAEVKPLVWQQSAQGATVATPPANQLTASARGRFGPVWLAPINVAAIAAGLAKAAPDGPQQGLGSAPSPGATPAATATRRRRAHRHR